MPKVTRSSKSSQPPPVRTTVLDKHRKYKAQTRVASGAAEVVVRQLRSVRIETHIVRREPLPHLSAVLPAAAFENGCRELFESLNEKGIRELPQRVKETQWLTKIDIDRYCSAFPPELRTHSYLVKYHFRALYITGFIDNLGPEASLSLQLVEYLESTETGRIYLHTVNKDPILRRYFRHLDEPTRKKYLIGRLWSDLRLLAEEGGLTHNRYLGYWHQHCVECRFGTVFGNTLCHCGHNRHVPYRDIESDTDNTVYSSNPFDEDTEEEEEDSVVRASNTLFGDTINSDEEDSVEPTPVCSLFPEDPEHYIVPPPVVQTTNTPVKQE